MERTPVITVSRNSRERWLDTLEGLRTIPDEEMKNLRSDVLAQPDTALEAFGARLVSRGRLTAWQNDAVFTPHTPLGVDQYVFTELLGEGGNSSVYKAVHRPTGAVVAVKLLAAGATRDEVASARFIREFQLAATLNHPNLVSVLDSGCTDGRHYLVMEYVSGQDLNRWLDEHPRLDAAFSCECIRQACMGLQHAFDKGMIHRDLKPANLMLTFDPEDHRPIVKILDMGLARFISDSTDRSQITGTGIFMGTPEYVSPEQALSARRADIRSDIYSLGCTLFRMLTGECPFIGENAVETLLARSTQDAPPLRSKLPSAPPDLEEVLSKMLQREPDNRFRQPHEVAAALIPFIGEYASRGIELSLPPRPPKSEPRLETPSPSVPQLPPPTPRPNGILRTPSRPDANVGAPPRIASSGPPRAASAGPRKRIKSTRVRAIRSKHAAYPTLVVGLGRIGALTLQAVHARATDPDGMALDLPIAFLGLDVDPEVFNEIASATSWSERAEDFLLCRFRKAQEYVRQWDELRGLSGWLNQEHIRNIPAAGGTGGSRPLGRLAAIENQRKIVARMVAKLQQLRAATSSIHGPKLTRIVVVAAMGGGTGSGMFLEVGELARQALAEVRETECEVVGALIAGAAADDDSPSRCQVNHIALVQDLQQHSDAPFDSVDFVDATAEHLSAPRLENTIETVADCVVHLAGTPLGRRIHRQARGEYWPRWRSVGAYVQEFPADMLYRRLAAAFAARVADAWLQAGREDEVQGACDFVAEWLKQIFAPSAVLQQILAELGRDPEHPQNLEYILNETLEIFGAVIESTNATGATVATACSVAVERFRQLFGGDGDAAEIAPDAAEMEEPLRRAVARTVAALAPPIVAMLQRLDASGANLDVVQRAWDAAVEFLADASAKQRNAVGAAAEQFNKAVEGLRPLATSLPKTPPRVLSHKATEVLEAVRQFALTKMQVVLAAKVGEFYSELRSELSDRARHVAAIRNAIERLAGGLAAEGASAETAGTSLLPRPMVLPSDVESIEELFNRWAAEIPASQLSRMPTRVSEKVLEPFGGIWQAFGREGAETELRDTLLRHVHEWLVGVLPPTDVAAILLQRSAEGSEERKVQLQSIADAARPSSCRILGPGVAAGLTSVDEHAFLSAPDSASGWELLLSLQRDALGPEPLAVADQNRFVLWRYYATDALRELVPAWVLAAHPAYEVACRNRRSPRIYPAPAVATTVLDS